jgi:hypothetical protein
MVGVLLTSHRACATASLRSAPVPTTRSSPGRVSGARRLPPQSTLALDVRGRRVPGSLRPCESVLLSTSGHAPDGQWPGLPSPFRCFAGKHWPQPSYWLGLGRWPVWDFHPHGAVRRLIVSRRAHLPKPLPGPSRACALTGPSTAHTTIRTHRLSLSSQPVYVI